MPVRVVGSNERWVRFPTRLEDEAFANGTPYPSGVGEQEHGRYPTDREELLEGYGETQDWSRAIWPSDQPKLSQAEEFANANFWSDANEASMIAQADGYRKYLEPGETLCADRPNTDEPCYMAVVLAQRAQQDCHSRYMLPESASRYHLLVVSSSSESPDILGSGFRQTDSFTLDLGEETLHKLAKTPFGEPLDDIPTDFVGGFFGFIFTPRGLRWQLYKQDVPYGFVDPNVLVTQHVRVLVPDIR